MLVEVFVLVTVNNIEIITHTENMTAHSDTAFEWLQTCNDQQNQSKMEHTKQILMVT